MITVKQMQTEKALQGYDKRTCVGCWNVIPEDEDLNYELCERCRERTEEMFMHSIQTIRQKYGDVAIAYLIDLDYIGKGIDLDD